MMVGGGARGRSLLPEFSVCFILNLAVDGEDIGQTTERLLLSLQKGGVTKHHISVTCIYTVKSRLAIQYIDNTCAEYVHSQLA